MEFDAVVSVNVDELIDLVKEGYSGEKFFEVLCSRTARKLFESEKLVPLSHRTIYNINGKTFFYIFNVYDPLKGIPEHYAVVASFEENVDDKFIRVRSVLI